MAQPQVAPFITEKLWYFFIGTTPDSAVLEEIATAFQLSDFDLSVVLRGLFNTEEFWNSQGTQIKSPMELIVGSTQLFDLPLATQNQFLGASRAMNQDLFDPPHVKGWAEGFAWYTSATLSTRAKVTQFVAQRANTLAEVSQALATQPVVSLPSSTHRNYLNLLVNDPAYQVS